MRLKRNIEHVTGTKRVEPSTRRGNQDKQHLIRQEVLSTILPDLAECNEEQLGDILLSLEDFTVTYNTKTLVICIGNRTTCCPIWK
jgi:hypothetical protein